MTLQALLDATPADSVLDLRGQMFELPPQTLLTAPRSLTVLGGTIVVPGGDVPSRPLFELSGLLNGARVEFRDTTIHGPDTTGWDPNVDVPHGAINWVKKQTWDSTLILDGCTITGGYGGAVIRNGGGRLDITRSHLEGWVYGVAFFEGHGGHGALTVRDTPLAAPEQSKVSSVGAYVHPHLDARFDNVDASGWGRFAVYFQGTPQSAGHHDLTEVRAVDCALVETGSSSRTTLTRCSETGVVSNGGSRFQGPVLSIESLWASTGMISVPKGMAGDRKFIGDVFCGANTWVASAGAATTGRIDFVDCAINLEGRSTALLLASPLVEATFTGCEITGTYNRAVNVSNGMVRFVDMPTPAPVRVAAPGVMC